MLNSENGAHPHFLMLYGAIAQILPNGEFEKCDPIFRIDDWDMNPPHYSLKKKRMDYLTRIILQEGRKNPNPYPVNQPYFYYQKIGEKVQFEKVDIRKYGSPIFLPASHKKINDGRTYFIRFEPTKNISGGTPCIAYSSKIKRINVGILFPKLFVTNYSDEEISEKELFAATIQKHI